ncbi:MAG: CoA ester lyase [Moraxella sp.]|nr:CoA ester lyase [Moraxella sp.]
MTNVQQQKSSYLFVPADRLDRVAKAVDSGADNVIIDLEDAVIGQSKEQLYQSLSDFCQSWDWQAFDKIWLRINGVFHPDFAGDVALVQRLLIYGVVLPKVRHADDVLTLKQHTNKPVIAMVECAKGVLNIAHIAKAGVWAMSYGCLDLAVSAGVAVGTPSARLFFDRVRTDLLLHSLANDISPPIETIYADIGDETGFGQNVQAWQDLGFGGQLLIHPKQVAIIKQMGVDKDKLAFAKKVVAHYKQTRQAVFSIDGQMVDMPVIRWANDCVAQATK